MRFVLNLSKGLVLEKNLTSSRMQLQYMWEWFATEYALSIEALAALGEDTLNTLPLPPTSTCSLAEAMGFETNSRR